MAEQITPAEKLRTCSLIDVDTGLKYCMNNPDFYTVILKEYLDGSRYNELEELFAAGNIAKYQVAVHSLKNTSLTIGACRLSQKAKALEQACKDGNREYLQKNHEPFLESYRRVLSEVSAAIA